MIHIVFIGHFMDEVNNIQGKNNAHLNEMMGKRLCFHDLNSTRLAKIMHDRIIVTARVIKYRVQLTSCGFP